MNRRNVLVLLAVLLVLCTMPTLSVSRAQAQELTLEQMFAQAVRAEGLEYVNARNAIIERKEEALPFLRSRLFDSDWHIRALARAMMDRIEDPEQCRTYEYRMIVPIVAAGMQHVVTFYSLDAVVNPLYALSFIRQATLSRSIARGTFGTDGAPFLVELALKGSVLKKPTVQYQLPSDDPDASYTIPEVAQILNVDENLAYGWMRSKAFKASKVGPLLVKHSGLNDFVRVYLRPDTSSSPVNPRFRESARCWAMLKLGDGCNDDATTIPLLVELLQSRESTKIRGYAALALGITGKEEAINPLTQAQNDPDEQVREAVQRSLTRLYRIIEVESEIKKE